MSEQALATEPRAATFVPGGGRRAVDDFSEIIAGLRAAHPQLVAASNDELLDLLSDFGVRLLRDPRTMSLDGVMFLAAWLKRRNVEGMLALNLGARVAALEGFVGTGAESGAKIAAMPHGLVSMWMAGNVPTLAAFSFIPALLARNVCLVKLADPDAPGMDAILDVLAESEGSGLTGQQVADCVAAVWYSSADRVLSEEMSRAADAKVVWGGRGAIEGVRGLPQQAHCVNIDFGPKYSIGVVDSELLAAPDRLDDAIEAYVRDVAIFDQRACSSPQTIFIEGDRATLRAVGERFATAFAKLPAKPALDAYTTVQIMNTRARWGLDEDRDVIASDDGANWTVCMDSDVRLKEAVQSRTVFLTAVDSWQDVIPLLSPAVQTIGIAFGDEEAAVDFATAASLAGAVRCVRPGLMNVQESPWDGRLLINDLVRWVTFKP